MSSSQNERPLRYRLILLLNESFADSLRAQGIDEWFEGSKDFPFSMVGRLVPELKHNTSGDNLYAFSPLLKDDINGQPRFRKLLAKFLDALLSHKAGCSHTGKAMEFLNNLTKKDKETIIKKMVPSIAYPQEPGTNDEELQTAFARKIISASVFNHDALPAENVHVLYNPLQCDGIRISQTHDGDFAPASDAVSINKDYVFWMTGLSENIILSCTPSSPALTENDMKVMISYLRALYDPDAAMKQIHPLPLSEEDPAANIAPPKKEENAMPGKEQPAAKAHLAPDRQTLYNENLMLMKKLLRPQQEEIFSKLLSMPERTYLRHERQADQAIDAIDMISIKPNGLERLRDLLHKMFGIDSSEH